MSIIPTKKQWNRWALPSKITFVSFGGSVVSIIFTISLLIYQPESSTNIQSKIKELSNIQSALVTLNDYVGNQKDSLTYISKQKEAIEEEKNRVEKALQIDTSKLDALLEYQLAQQKKDIWLELFISFFIGVLSSSIVTFVATKFQKKRTIDESIET
ncbi:hypothetical protein [Pseudoalteromonas marina]|uniref:hypothetical protein n=1 Tax=Pseudoalteromonas marina TaxID=267375 RepID=UPI0023EF99C6|nr:hypothetical protein [Pseudoalteromonas marina]